MTDDVKDGAVGAAIQGPPANEDPSKLKQFFTDPKNLATMLVLGSALAQNRRGQSFGAHLGKAATGSLAFRGGLDKGIEDRQQAELEAESVQGRRASQTANEEARIGVEQDRNRITEENYGVLDENADLDRASRERVAGIQRTAITPAPLTLEQVYSSARKDISDAYAAWYAGGQFGPAPDENQILTRHLQMWDMQQRGITVDFEPLPGAGGETTVEPAESLPTRTISAATRNRVIRNRETFEMLGFQPGQQTTTQEVDQAINSYDEGIRRRAEAGQISPEEARELRMGPNRFLLINPATRAALQRIEQGKTDAVLIPTEDQLTENQLAATERRERAEAQTAADQPHGGRTKF